MLLGIKSKKVAFYRHLTVASVAGLLIYLVWALNSTWSPDMRLWKAFGGGSFFLLWFTVFIGPASRLFPSLNRILTFRRETGVWFFLVALVHGYLILDGWVRWGVWEFFGYQYVAELDTYLRVESGFGVANMAGLLALAFALTLAATSFDRAVNFLGMSSWKWLHTFAYVIFYLTVIHVVYFAFIHYTPSLQRVVMGTPTNYPVNPLKYYYLGALLSVFIAQTWVFIKTVTHQRKEANTSVVSTTKVAIISKRKVAKATTEITFARPRDFKFKAGQYVQVALDSSNYPDPKGLSRTFSICSSPCDEEKIAIVFRNTGSGYKKTLSELPEGSTVLLEGPFGHFVLPNSEDIRHICIAGGIGVSPFLSMIKYIVEKEQYFPITLLYANREKESSAYLEDLEKLSAISGTFSLDPIFGRIDASHIQKHVREIDNTIWWIVGPPGMVAEIKHLLSSLDIPDDKIRTEEFIGY